MTKIQNSSTHSVLLDDPSQPKGSSKSANVVDSPQVEQNENIPFDERENLMFSDGANAGVFFSPSEEDDEAGGESRTGPSSDISSSGLTAIVATTAIELITAVKADLSMDDSPPDTTTATKWNEKTRSLGNALRGRSLIGNKKAKKPKTTDTQNNSNSASSYPSDLDDEIMLIREGGGAPPTPSPNQILSELDDEIMMVREGSPEQRSQVPPTSSTLFQLARSEEDLLFDLDDEIFEVREGTPKSSFKTKDKSTAPKTVRFAFGQAARSRASSDDFGLGRNMDIDTLLVDSDSEDEDEDGSLMDETASMTSSSIQSGESSNKPASSTSSTQAGGDPHKKGLADFLNDLEKPNNGEFDYEDGTDGSCSVDTNDTNDTDGESVTLHDCWELACV